MYLYYTPESRRKRPLEAIRPFSKSESLHWSTKKGDGESSSRTGYESKLCMKKELNAREDIAGSLFDEGAQPTARLGQLLRGLAKHLIEDCEPRESVVVTPEKMIKYYTAAMLQNELYPWSSIFSEHSSISRIYQELGCRHHLVQRRSDQKPDIPGLTPVGFGRWMPLLIQAHPDNEYRRLRKTILEILISN